MGEHCAIMATDWEIGRAEQDELALASHRNLAAAYERGFLDDLITPYLGLDRDAEPAPRLQPREAGQAEAGLRRPRGDDDRRQLDAALRRRLGGAARLRGVGEGTRPAGPRLLHRGADRRRRPRPQARRPADGAGLRDAGDARPGRPGAAGLRLLRDPRGLRRAGALHAEGLGGRGVLQGEAGPRRAARRDRPRQAQRQRRLAWPPPTRSRRPAGGSSPASPSSCTKTAPAAA